MLHSGGVEGVRRTRRRVRGRGARPCCVVGVCANRPPRSKALQTLRPGCRPGGEGREIFEVRFPISTKAQGRKGGRNKHARPRARTDKRKDARASHNTPNTRNAAMHDTHKNLNSFLLPSLPPSLAPRTRQQQQMRKEQASLLREQRGIAAPPSLTRSLLPRRRTRAPPHQRPLGRRPCTCSSLATRTDDSTRAW